MKSSNTENKMWFLNVSIFSVSLAYEVKPVCLDPNGVVSCRQYDEFELFENPDQLAKNLLDKHHETYKLADL